MALAAEIPSPGENSIPEFNRPVDLVHLARFTMGNRALEREVLQLFLTQSVMYLQRLKDAVADKDWVDAAHTIKGTARGIGAWQVARSAESAEALGGEGHDEERSRVLADIEQFIGEANKYIESLLSET